MSKRDQQQIEADRIYTLRRVCQEGSVRVSLLLPCARTLEKSGLIEKVKFTKSTVYRATPAGLAALEEIDTKRALLGKEDEV